MSDLISREKAIEVLKEYEVVESDNFTRTDPVSMMSVATIANCIEAIVELPSAESKRNKGKWLRRKDEDCWECSECHAVLENSDIGNHNYYYCYHCGADMKDICGYMDLEKANYE